MKPPRREKTQFERIPRYLEWIEGTIIDVQYDLEHKRSFKGEEKIGPCVRFKLGLKGCEYPHSSRWMSFSYSEKATLYKKYLVPLVEDAAPYMDFDLDELKGFSINTMWSCRDEFDNLEMIKPASEKIKQKNISKPDPEPQESHEVPF